MPPFPALGQERTVHPVVESIVSLTPPPKKQQENKESQQPLANPDVISGSIISYRTRKIVISAQNSIMADPLSIAAGVAGLITLGVQVTQSLVEFYTSYKHQDSEIAGMTERLENLLSVLQNLDKTLSDRKFHADERSLIGNIENSIKNCDELIQELQEECRKFAESTSGGIKAVLRAAGRRATYPFRQSTLEKLDEIVGELYGNISIAIDVLQLKDSKRTQDDIADLKLLLDLVRTRQLSANIRDWLKAPDATVNHNAACAKKHPGTGIWFVNSPSFTAWLTNENSFLWLSGFAGSGKSVLSSTTIQFAFRHRRSNPQIGIAFFYFTFNDESKQDESAMLRALLLQLSGQLEDGHLDLARLYESYKTGIPPSSALTQYLRRLIQRFHQVYIVLDALDETPRLGPRQHVLETIEAMQMWSLPGLHLFVTSRDEPDIRNLLDFTLGQEVKMKNAGIDKDITDFISSRLQKDKKLRKWLPYSDKIQKTLAERAQGV